MEITRCALENMMMVYVDHKKTILDLEKAHVDEEGFYEDGDYNFHKGCCETAEG